ncbi:MAG: hypothetical protein EKK61_03550 [Rickettsiales bacterium]|nr:MAG: hypothetical protein EKK61_03550 [Rickettsiales bacterium]
MANVAEKIFELDANTSKIIKELLQLKGVYQELTDEQVKQVAELKELELAEKKLKAARDASNNPTAYIRINKQIDENTKKLGALKEAVDKFTATNVKAKSEADALGTSLSNAFKGTQVNAVQNASKSFRNLQTSINQVTRELPAFTVSANTGFLAISNNLPILFDALARINAENKQLAANGEKTKSALSQVAGAVFSFGSIMSIGVTLLTLYGKEIVNWVAELFEGEKALKATTEANEYYNKSISKTKEEIGDLIIKLKVQSGILTKVEGDLLGNERGRKKAIQESNVEKLKTIKAAKEELGLTDRIIANYKKTITYYSAADKEMKTRQLNSDAENRAVERYNEAISNATQKNRLNNQYINEQYNLRGKLIQAEETENSARQKAVELELIRQKSIADQIKQLQIESIEDDKTREIALAVFKTQKAFDELDTANEIEKEKIRISEINYRQRVAMEKAEATRRGDSAEKLNNQLSYLEQQHLKEIQKIHAENIPEAEQADYREALADKLAQDIQGINLKYEKETNEKILADFKLTLESRKAIIKENADYEIYKDEETLKRLESNRKLSNMKAIKELRKKLYDEQIARLNAAEKEELEQTDNAAKKLEIQNRYRIAREKMQKKQDDDDNKRRKEQLQKDIDALADLVKAVVSATNQIISLKIKELDTQTSLQQKRVDDAKAIADRGNAQQLQLEQKRLDDLNKKRENYVRQQQALATVELVANTAVAISKAASQTGVAAGVGIAAALIALVAGLASARAIAGQAAYYEGGYTGDGNPRDESRTMGGRRTSRPYIWHKGEFVMDHKKTRKYRDIFEDVHAGKVDLREWQEKAAQYDLLQNRREFMLNQNYAANQGPVNIDFSSMEKEMKSINENLRGLYFGLNVDENGFTMRQRRILDRKTEIKNNAKL